MKKPSVSGDFSGSLFNSRFPFADHTSMNALFTLRFSTFRRSFPLDQVPEGSREGSAAFETRKLRLYSEILLISSKTRHYSFNVLPSSWISARIIAFWDEWILYASATSTWAWKTKLGTRNSTWRGQNWFIWEKYSNTILFIQRNNFRLNISS